MKALEVGPAMDGEQLVKCANCGKDAKDGKTLGLFWKAVFLITTGGIITGKVCRNCLGNVQLILGLLMPFALAAIVVGIIIVVSKI